MAIVVIDDSCLQAKKIKLVKFAYRRTHSPSHAWLGLRVDGCLALFYIHQMNRVNSRNDLVVMMTAL